jgi:hypothetical protein
MSMSRSIRQLFEASLVILGELEPEMTIEALRRGTHGRKAVQKRGRLDAGPKQFTAEDDPWKYGSIN